MCGQKIEEGTSCHTNIMMERELVPPQSVGTSVKNFRRDAKYYNERATSYYDVAKNYLKEMLKAQKDQREFKEERERLEEKISEGKHAESITRVLNELKRNRNIIESKLNNCVKQLGEYEAKLVENKTKIDKYMASSKGNEEIKLYIKYAEAIHSFLQEDYKAKEKELREKLNEKVNDLFVKMYHGERRVKILDNYQVDLIVNNNGRASTGIKLDESRGLETVKNFAFVAGLIDLAKERLITKDFDLLDEVSEREEIIYPLVMDAPFSNADEKHVSKISEALPEIAEQIIMVVMEKDWKYAENTISSRLGKKYRISKVSETESYLKEAK